jgi:hypothetical protein
MNAQLKNGVVSLTVSISAVDAVQLAIFVKNLLASSRIGEFTVRPSQVHGVLSKVDSQLKKLGFIL